MGTTTPLAYECFILVVEYEEKAFWMAFVIGGDDQTVLATDNKFLKNSMV
jgi:hypothetical protein